MAGPLEGIRVVDLSTVILGPWAAQTLGDMGADVIKVEPPSGDIARHSGPRKTPMMASLYMGANRNKRSIVLDITQDSGRDALLKLISQADVLLHNMRPKVMRKFRLDYETVSKDNPDLIYCATFGFRSEGPMADKPAYDDVIQAASGLSELQSVISGEPRYVPTVMADKTTGLNVLSAILAALFHRERGGGGQAIEVPMFETLVDFIMVEHLCGAMWDPPIAEMGYQRILNTQRRPYPTKDGYLSVLPYTDENWRGLAKIAGREDLLDNPIFVDLPTRVKHSEEIYAILAEIIATRTTAEWQRDLDAVNVPVQAVYSKEDLLDNEQLDASGFWHHMAHPSEGPLRLTDPPIRFSNSPSTIRRLQPRLGEHSAEILAEAGYSEGEIAEMMESGASRQDDWQGN